MFLLSKTEAVHAHIIVQSSRTLRVGCMPSSDKAQRLHHHVNIHILLL